MQIEKYIISPKADQATPSLKRILADRKEENRERRLRLVEQMGNLMTTGDFYVLGQKPSIKVGLHPISLLDELVNYLIANTYSKLPYLKHRCSDPVAEIKAVLSADDIKQLSPLENSIEELNPLALNELRQYLLLTASENRLALRYCRSVYRYSLGLET